jgi:hypothetical protein
MAFAITSLEACGLPCGEGEPVMARWRLTDAHYLQVPGTEWEYKETDRETQRQVRKVYEIPLYLNPKERSDWNYPQDEAIIVSSRFDKAHPRDIVFTGPPTPDMDPVDEEAEKISQGYRDSGAWQHPIDALNMTYSQSVLSDFERLIAQKIVEQNAKSPPNMSLGGVSAEDFAKLQEQVTRLMEQNARLQADLLEKRAVRRV